MEKVRIFPRDREPVIVYDVIIEGTKAGGHIPQFHIAVTPERGIRDDSYRGQHRICDQFKRVALSVVSPFRLLEGNRAERICLERELQSVVACLLRNARLLNISVR